MMGLPDSEYRLTTIRLPGSPLLLEFLELKGLAPVTTPSRVQDPGSFRLQLNVRDIDATVGALASAGSTVVSSGRVPVSMTFNTRPWRLAIAPDPNNLFLVVQQGPPPAPPAVAQSPAPAASRCRRPPTRAAAHGAVITKYCVSCHNSRTRTADLALDAVNLANVANDAPVWEKVVRKLRAGVDAAAGHAAAGRPSRPRAGVVARDHPRSRGRWPAQPRPAGRCTG